MTSEPEAKKTCCPLEQMSVKVIISSFFCTFLWPTSTRSSLFLTCFLTCCAREESCLFHVLKIQDSISRLPTDTEQQPRRPRRDLPPINFQRENSTPPDLLLHDVVPICSVRAEARLNKKPRVTVAVASSSPRRKLQDNEMLNKWSEKLDLFSSNRSQVPDPACCASAFYCCVGQLFVFYWHSRLLKSSWTYSGIVILLYWPVVNKDSFLLYYDRRCICMSWLHSYLHSGLIIEEAAGFLVLSVLFFLIKSLVCRSENCRFSMLSFHLLLHSTMGR